VYNEFLQIRITELKVLEISTQKTFPMLDSHGHDMDSRPDLVIRFSQGGQDHIVFLERKLGSQEGCFHLKRRGSNNQWNRWLRPAKGDKQWVDGRSAKELVKA
jgi:hypothetical protein